IPMKPNNQVPYDIQFNKLKQLPPLQESDIPSFDSVMAEHTIMLKKFKTQMTVRYSLSSVAIIAVVFCSWWFLKKDVQQLPIAQKTVVKVADTTVVKAPVAEWDIPYQTYKVNADSLSVIKMASGTQLTIAPGILTDEAGEPVKGEVSIECREFFDPIDIMVAGIPMSYDSAGIQYTLETAGMLEINGKQNNKALKIAEGKAIEIAQISRGDNTYNTYSLNTKTGAWQYEGRPNVIDKQVMPEIGKAPKQQNTTSKSYATVDEIKQISQPQVVAPKVHNEANRSFRLDVDQSRFPELGIYSNVLFEILPGQNFTSTNEEWDWIELKQGSKANEYKVVLYDKGQKHNVSVAPVFSAGEDYESALKKFKAYEKLKLSDIERGRKAQIEQAKKDEALYQDQIKNKKIMQERLIKEFEKNQALQNKVQVARNFNVNPNLAYGEVVREFSASRFGYWNSDRPYMFNSPVKRTVVVKVNEHQLNTNLDQLYQIEKSTNALMVNYCFGANGYTITYNPNEENIWFMVIPGTKKIAVLSAVKFKAMTNNMENVLEMTTIDKEFKNAEELKAYILTEEY
ncbi:MAG: hypothetical protein V4613_03765, partial [Bacteroidota bacterium]